MNVCHCHVCAAEPGSAMLEHFNHLRRQWASKAQVLLANLQDITSTDVDTVLSRSRDVIQCHLLQLSFDTDAFDELLHLSKRISVATSPVQKAYSDEDLSLREERPTRRDLEVQESRTPK